MQLWLVNDTWNWKQIIHLVRKFSFPHIYSSSVCSVTSYDRNLYSSESKYRKLVCTRELVIFRRDSLQDSFASRFSAERESNDVITVQEDAPWIMEQEQQCDKYNRSWRHEIRTTSRHEMFAIYCQTYIFCNDLLFLKFKVGGCNRLRIQMI